MEKSLKVCLWSTCCGDQSSIKSFNSASCLVDSFTAWTLHLYSRPALQATQNHHIVNKRPSSPNTEQFKASRVIALSGQERRTKLEQVYTSYCKAFHSEAPPSFVPSQPGSTLSESWSRYPYSKMSVLQSIH